MFVWLHGPVIRIKRGLCTCYTRCIDPSWCWQLNSVVIPRCQNAAEFSPGAWLMVAELWPACLGHCIMARLVTSGGGVTMWWPLGMIHQPRDTWVAITPLMQYDHTPTFLTLHHKSLPRNIRQQLFRPLLSDKAGNHKMLSIFWHSQLCLCYSCICSQDNNALHI